MLLESKYNFLKPIKTDHLIRMGWKSKYNFFSELTDILKYKTSK